MSIFVGICLLRTDEHTTSQLLYDDDEIWDATHRGLTQTTIVLNSYKDVEFPTEVTNFKSTVNKFIQHCISMRILI